MQLNEYELNLKSRFKVDEHGVDENINYTVKYVEVCEAFPEYIAEEVFDALVAKLKQDLIDRQILLLTLVYPCTGCNMGYSTIHGSIGQGGNIFFKSCEENCLKLKQYKELEKQRQEAGR